MVVYTVSKEENFMQLKTILRANNDFLNDLKEKLKKVRFTTTLKKIINPSICLFAKGVYHSS